MANKTQGGVTASAVFAPRNPDTCARVEALPSVKQATPRDARQVTGDVPVFCSGWVI